MISYEWSSTGPVPHWVWLFRSEFPADCAAIKGADSDGWQPPSSFALVHDGRHRDSLICDDSTVPVADLSEASVATVLYVRRGDCCTDPIPEPCNIPPEGDCEGIPSGEVCPECTNCDDETAPVAVLLEIDHNTDWLEFADGSFVLTLAGGCGSGVGRQCEWTGCFPLETGEFIPSHGLTIRSLTMRLVYGSGTMQLRIEYHSTDDCGAASSTCTW